MFSILLPKLASKRFPSILSRLPHVRRFRGSVLGRRERGAPIRGAASTIFRDLPLPPPPPPFSKTSLFTFDSGDGRVCLRRDEQQVGQQVRDVVYPCAPVCASAAAAALRVWSIAPSSPLTTTPEIPRAPRLATPTRSWRGDLADVARLRGYRSYPGGAVHPSLSLPQVRGTLVMVSRQPSL